MGYFDDIFGVAPPKRRVGGYFSDIFGSFDSPEVGPPSPQFSKLDELARAREAGDRQWSGISAGQSDSPDSTLGAWGSAIGNTAADLGRAVVQSGTGIQEAIGGLEQAAGEQFGWDSLAQRGQEIGANARRTNDLIAPSQPREESVLRDFAQGVAANMPQLGVGALVGPAFLPFLAGQAAGQEYSQGRSIGASPEGAGTAALGVGGFEALTEQFGDVRLVKKMLGQVAKAKTVEEGIGKFLGDVAINAGEEGAADIGDRLARWIGYSDKQFGPGWWKGTLNSMAQGAVMPVGAHLSTAESGLPWKSELETSQMNNAFAEGVTGPKPGLFTDIFHDPSLAAPESARATIAPPGMQPLPWGQSGPPAPVEQAGPPVPTLMQATQDAREQFLQVPESARIAAQMGETARAQDDRANLAADALGARTPAELAQGMGMKANYMDFLAARDRRPADLSAPPVAPGIEFQPAPQTERVRRQEKLKPIDQMTPEELRAEAEIARMDTALGVGNRRAFFSEEDNPSSSQRVTWHIDLNGLGGVNDKISHTAGDAFLNKFVAAAKNAGLNIYRVGGDEFGGHERFGKHAEEKIAALKKSLEADPVVLRDADGVEWEIPVTFGHGVSANYQRADAGSIAAKEQQRALGLRGQKGELPPNTRRAGTEVSGGEVSRVQERSDPTLNPKPTDQAGIDYLTKNVTSALPSKEEVQPMEKWKPTNWTAKKSGDEPFHWKKVNGVGDVFGASDGAWMLLGKPEKGKTYRTNSAEPANVADERVDETVDESGASVESQFKKAQQEFDRARQRSSLFTKLEPRGFSGKGHQAEVWLNNGRAMKGRDFDFIQRNAPGARWFGEQGMATAWLVDENGKVVGFFGTKVRGSAVSTTEQQMAQNEREPGDDPPDPEDPYARTPASVEDNSDLPEALRIVGPRALPDVDPTKLKTWLRKWFTSKGNVSKEFRGIGEKREGAMAAGTIQHKEIAYALQHHQRAYLKAHPNVNQTAFIEAIRDVIHGTPKIGSVPLPAKIQNLAERARALVDSYSAAHVAQLQKMDPDSELAKVIEGNLGTYLNRAYQAFDDPHHLERVKESGLWDHYKAQIAALPEMQGKSDAEVEGLMNHLADRKEDSFGSHGHGMGTLEMGIYKARKEIPTVIRQLMGEYTDPAVEFFQTAEKLNRNVATTEMYLALDELGTKEGWLTKDKAPVGELYKQIGGKAERSPIGGKFTNKEMHEIIVGAHENAQRGILNWLTGIIKTNKTVGSVQAQTRNFESQSLLLSAAGNLGARFTPWGWKTPAAIGLKAAAQQSRLRAGIHADRAGSLANMSNEELAGSWGRGAKLGVNGGGTPDLADIRHFLRESDKLVDPSNPIEKTWSALKSAYKAGDDIPRHAAWQSETAKILWHSPGTSLADAEAQAADLVRDQNPTDGRQMRALKVLRKTPMVGGFISFVSEIPRNAKNIAAQGVKELKDGHAEGNKRKMIVGAHRLGSLAATLAAPELMAAAIMGLRHGDDDEAKDAENKAVLRFAPPWMKNSTLNVLHVKDGKAFVVDVSFMDPWATIKKPIMAAIRTGKAAGKDSGDVALSVLRQIGEPYAQEGLGLTTVMDMARNADRYGGQITSPNAPLGKRISDYASYLGKAVEPGTVTSARRIKKAVTGEVEKSGRGYSLLGEVAALFGPRFMEIDARQGLKYAGLDYLKGQQDASRSLNEVTRRQGRITPDEIADAQATADKAYEVGAYALIDAVEAARTLGLSKGDIIKALTGKEGAGLSRDDVGAALVGIDELDRRRLSKAKTRAEHDRLLARKR